MAGVECALSDNHAGLKPAIAKVLSEAVWQRCYAHFLRNALVYPPRKANNNCRQGLHSIYDRRCLEEAQRDLAAWLKKWPQKYPKLDDWVEENIAETWAYIGSRWLIISS